MLNMMNNSGDRKVVRFVVHLSIAACAALVAPPSRGDEHSAENASYVEPPITASDRDHWSLKPRTPVEIPATLNEHWQRNPVDAFIAAELESRGLTPQPEADRRTLIRRVSLDLTGLPPTPDEVATFIADESPTAFELLVDRLLALPAYGERSAQHWLDLARFAETDGFEHDKIRANAWQCYFTCSFQRQTGFVASDLYNSQHFRRGKLSFWEGG